MQEQMQVQKTGFWESRVECVTAPSQWALAKKLNDFYAGKFVIATQTFYPRRDGELWTGLVYFKVKV